MLLGAARPRPDAAQTAARPPDAMRRDRLGHGPSGDIADHYAHICDEMIEDMLAGQTRRCQAAVMEVT